MAINTTKTINAPHSRSKIWKKFRRRNNRKTTVSKSEFFILPRNIFPFDSPLFCKLEIPTKKSVKKEKNVSARRKRNTKIFNQ